MFRLHDLGRLTMSPHESLVAYEGQDMEIQILIETSMRQHYHSLSCFESSNLERIDHVSRTRAIRGTHLPT